MRVYQMAFKGDYMALWFGNDLVAIGKWGGGILPLEQAEALGLKGDRPNLASKLVAKDDADAVEQFADWVNVLAQPVTV